MLSGRNRHPKLDSKLRAVLFVLAGVLALLTIGLGTALAEGEEEAGGPTDPVVVPGTETPPVTNPTTTPSEPASTPVTSSPAPVVKAPESSPTSSSGTRTSSPSTGTRGSSGGSNGSPTQANSGVDSGSGGDSGRSNSGGSTGTSGGGSTTSAPTSTSSPTATAGADLSTSGIESAASALADRAGHATGGDRESRQKAVGDLGEAVGKALLGNGVSVAEPKHHNDGVADFVPLSGKSKTLYVLLILIVLAIASFVVWTQFRGPRASRRRKAHIDHRVTSAARLTPTERLRARQWSTEHARPAARRTTRRKAA